jgi:hypothetical protein
MQHILLYIDPGSGSYLIQLIIAGVLGALFYFKTIWWKIKSFFTRSKPEDSSNKEEDDDE